MANEFKDHVIITDEELKGLLGMEGDHVRVWVEPETSWVHVITESSTPFKNCQAVAYGGYPENRMPTEERLPHGEYWGDAT